MKRPLPMALAALLVVVSLTVGLTAVLASGGESNGRARTIATGSPEVGTVLVDRRGRTLYLFQAATPWRRRQSTRSRLVHPSGDLLARPPEIERVDVLAAKLGTGEQE